MRSYAFTAPSLPSPSDVEAEFTRREILAEVTLACGELRVEADAPLIVVHEIARMFRCRVGRAEALRMQTLPRTSRITRRSL